MTCSFFQGNMLGFEWFDFGGCTALRSQHVRVTEVKKKIQTVVERTVDGDGTPIERTIVTEAFYGVGHLEHRCWEKGNVEERCLFQVQERVVEGFAIGFITFMIIVEKESVVISSDLRQISRQSFFSLWDMLFKCKLSISPFTFGILERMSVRNPVVQHRSSDSYTGVPKFVVVPPDSFPLGLDFGFSNLPRRCRLMLWHIPWIWPNLRSPPAVIQQFFFFHGCNGRRLESKSEDAVFVCLLVKLLMSEILHHLGCMKP